MVGDYELDTWNALTHRCQANQLGVLADYTQWLARVQPGVHSPAEMKWKASPQKRQSLTLDFQECQPKHDAGKGDPEATLMEYERGPLHFCTTLGVHFGPSLKFLAQTS